MRRTATQLPSDPPVIYRNPPKKPSEGKQLELSSEVLLHLQGLSSDTLKPAETKSLIEIILIRANLCVSISVGGETSPGQFLRNCVKY